jgi:hypothetical protein
MPGYLLLALEAHHSKTDQEALAQERWMESLDVVRAGKDDRAEELIHTPTDFPPDPMLHQTANALRMYLASDPRWDETSRSPAETPGATFSSTAAARC